MKKILFFTGVILILIGIAMQSQKNRRPLKKNFPPPQFTVEDFQVQSENKKWALPPLTAKDFEDPPMTSNQSVNELVNTYDPILSSIQYYYRIWLEDENQKIFNNIDLFQPDSISNLIYIEANIGHLMHSIDTVRSYLKELAYVSAEYGIKLTSTINENKVKSEFQTKWREYNEGITEVMNYDVERIIQYLTVFIYLRDNHSKFEVKGDTIYFLDDSSLWEYKKLLSSIRDQKILTKQQTTKTQTIHTYLEAMNLVKGND